MSTHIHVRKTFSPIFILEESMNLDWFIIDKGESLYQALTL